MSNTYKYEMTDGFPLLPATYYEDTLQADKVDAAFDGLSQVIRERMTVSLTDPNQLKLLYYLDEDDSVTPLTGIDLTDPQQKTRLVNMAAANRLYGYSAGQTKLQQISLLGMDEERPRLQINYVNDRENDDDLRQNHVDAMRRRLANKAPTPPEKPEELQTPPPSIKWYMKIAHFFSKNAYKSVYEANERYQNLQTEYQEARRGYEQKRQAHERLRESYLNYSNHLGTLREMFSEVNRHRESTMEPTERDEMKKEARDEKKKREKRQHNKTHEPEIFREYHAKNEKDYKPFVDAEEKYNDARTLYNADSSSENHQNLIKAKEEYRNFQVKEMKGEAPMHPVLVQISRGVATEQGSKERKEHNTGIEQKVETEKKSIIERFPQRNDEIAHLTAELTEKYRDKTDAEKLEGINTLIGQVFDANPYTVRGAASIRAAKALYEGIDKSGLNDDQFDLYDSFKSKIQGLNRMDNLLQRGRDAELKLSQLGENERPEKYQELVRDVLVCHVIRRNMIARTTENAFTGAKSLLSGLCGMVKEDNLVKKVTKGYDMDALYAKDPEEILDMAHGKGGFDVYLTDDKKKVKTTGIKVEVHDIKRLRYNTYREENMSKDEIEKTKLNEEEQKETLGAKYVDTFHI